MFLKSLIATLTIAVTPAWAQMNPSLMGTGYWGGNQGCAYQQRPAQAMNTESEEVREIKEKIAELKQEISEKKKEKRQFDREVTHAKSDIQKSIADQYADPIMQHIDGFRSCSEYTGFNKNDSSQEIGAAESNEDTPIVSSNEDMPEPPEGAAPSEGFEPPTSGSAGRKMPPRNGSRPSMAKSSQSKSQGRGANSNMLNLQGFSLQEWQSYCDSSKSGSVFAAVCDNSKFRADSSGRSSSSTCKKAITTYRTNSQKSSQIQSDIDSLTREIEYATEDLKEARNDKSGTEGDVCIECMAKNNSYNYQNSQADTTNLVANVALAGAGMLASYKTNQMISDNNANAGYPSTTQNFNYPFMMQGLYGALSSSAGQGGFGCSNTLGGMNGMSSMGGAFGYPSSMMNMGMMGMSGGLYTGMGMGMGMNNMYGMNGMYGMGNMYGMSGMNNMYGMNGMNSMNGMYGLNSMYTNPYSMYGSMYGSNPYQYSAMNSLQQQMMMMNYQMSGYSSSLSGIYGNSGVSYTNGVYTGRSSYISPTGLSNASTLSNGVITGSSYLSPYSTSLSNSVTVPGIVPYPTTTSTSSGLIYGTGR